MNLTTKVRIACFSVMMCIIVLMLASICNNELYKFRRIKTDKQMIEVIETYEKTFKEKIEKIKMNQPNYDPEYYQRIVSLLKYYEEYPYAADKAIYEKDSISVGELRKNFDSPERRGFAYQRSTLNISDQDEFLFNSSGVASVIKNYDTKSKKGETFAEYEVKEYERAKKALVTIEKDITDYILIAERMGYYLQVSQDLADLIYIDVVRESFFLTLNEDPSETLDSAIFMKYHILDLYLDFLMGVAN